jgi:hypothetical protein
VIELAIDGDRIAVLHVLLSGDPRVRDLSLATIVGDALYLNATAGWEHYKEDGSAKPGPAAPHVFLKLAL